MANPIELGNSLVELEALGKGLKSPLEQDPYTGDFKISEREENVKSCISDLIGTPVGTRVFNEDFGSPFPPLLFENIPGLLDILPLHARAAILRYEPRVKDVAASAKRVGENAIVVRITYVIKATGAQANLTYPFYTEPPESDAGE